MPRENAAGQALGTHSQMPLFGSLGCFEDAVRDVQWARNSGRLDSDWSDTDTAINQFACVVADVRFCGVGGHARGRQAGYSRIDNDRRRGQSATSD
ncbi:hypothetical protein Dda_1508 [Drechslerella dactyloides]|uniref:Uncharacterized protein n=1 Tax=Drechslerella dactyloides TaxID=74499 RepID=A0AAD6J474_DREDA|nr:hypothetical protein Dda_1508 [Drechslerella dactyloides]